MVSTSQLLYCLRNSVKKVSTTNDENEKVHLAQSIDQVLNILLLQQDTAFYIEHYRKGLDLIRQGAALSGSDFGRILKEFPAELDAGYSPDMLELQLQKLSAALGAIVEVLPSSGIDDVKQFLDAATEWEVAIYAKRLEQVQQPESHIGHQAEIDKEQFEKYLGRKFPEWRNLKVTRFNRLTGGFSKITILVETEDDTNGHQSLVIRAMQPTYICKLHAYRLSDEYPIVRIAFDAGVPVAEPLWFEEDETALGAAFMVSKRVAGEVKGTALGPTGAISETMMRSMLAALVRVHNVQLQNYEEEIRQSEVLSKWYAYKTVSEYNKERNRYWRNLADEADAIISPVFARAFKWLNDNIEPCDEAPTLLHGDYGLHNILIEGDRVTALLDWEVSHIGDPSFELSWLYLCTGKQFTPEQILRMYHEEGGREISEYAFHYHQVFHCIMMPITCIAALKLLDSRLDNILYASYGLLFMHYNTSILNQAIELAEKCKQ